jgi:Biopolymer transport proteins
VYGLELSLLSAAADEASTLGFLGNWKLLGGLMQTVILILAVMLIRTLSISADRLLKFWTAWRQSRSFVRLLGKDYLSDPGRVRTLAKSHVRSHIATIITAGLAAFQQSSQWSCHVDTIESCQRAMRRVIGMTRAEFRYGLATLAQIASVSPLIGLVGTVLGIFSAFGRSGAAAAVRAFTAERTSESLITAALGLLVGLAALWAHSFFCNWLSALELQMETTSSELIVSLSRQRDSGPPVYETRPNFVLLNLETISSGTQAWEVSADSQVFFLVPLWLPLLYCVYALVRAF